MRRRDTRKEWSADKTRRRRERRRATVRAARKKKKYIYTYTRVYARKTGAKSERRKKKKRNEDGAEESVGNLFSMSEYRRYKSNNARAAFILFGFYSISFYISRLSASSSLGRRSATLEPPLSPAVHPRHSTTYSCFLLSLFFFSFLFFFLFSFFPYRRLLIIFIRQRRFDCEHVGCGQMTLHFASPSSIAHHPSPVPSRIAYLRVPPRTAAPHRLVF